MKVSKHDIGGELISILTKGMYADPRDAIREYVQNGIDASAERIIIRVRNDSIAVIDNGKGMDKAIMRRAVRVGISDKNPSRSVGFMGIGIYSSFHLCDSLDIYSKIKDEVPNRLTFRFKDMREALEDQKDSRITGDTGMQQVDLQSLLEQNIDFVSLPEGSFPNVGTRIEMSGIEPNFFKSLSKFEEVAEYLESVVPLPFSNLFTKGDIIQKHIDTVCKKHKMSFRLINLFLNLNGTDIQLFRPYKDADFSTGKSGGKPLEPEFYEMKSGDEFLGIAWACLNSARDTIPNSKVRGFIIKKQGFTIGKRSDLLQYFGRQTYFNRAVGEFLALNPRLLPNAPRSDFEYSALRTSFYGEVKEVAKLFSKYADEYQESEKAEVDLKKSVDLFNEITAQLDFFESNSDKLLQYFGDVTDQIESLSKRISGERFRKDSLSLAKEMVKKMTNLKNDIKALIDNKKKKKSTTKKSAAATIKKIVDAKIETGSDPIPEDLSDIIYSLGLELNDSLAGIINLVDEKFIRGSSSSRDDYQKKLLALRDEIEQLLEEE
jgi:hypothetical protein